MTSNWPVSTSTPIFGRSSSARSGRASHSTRVRGAAQPGQDVAALWIIGAVANDDGVAGADHPLQCRFAASRDVDCQAHLLEHHHGGQRDALLIRHDQRAAASAEAWRGRSVVHRPIPPAAPRWLSTGLLAPRAGGRAAAEPSRWEVVSL